MENTQDDTIEALTPIAQGQKRTIDLTGLSPPPVFRFQARARLQEGEVQPEGLRASTHAPSAHQAQETLERASFSGQIESVQQAIDIAFDCLTKAIPLEKDRTKARNLSDLIQVFRDFTEKGAVSRAKAAFQGQLRHLENTANALANRTKELKKAPAATTPTQPTRTPIPPQTQPYAQSQPRHQPQIRSFVSVARSGEEWKEVPTKAAARKPTPLPTKISR